MASLCKEKNGNFRVQFIAIDGKRKSISIGKQGDRKAARFRDKIEALLSALKTDCVLDDDIQDWLIRIADTPLSEKLQSVGLVKKQLKLSLDALLGEYLGFKKQTNNPKTILTLDQTIRRLTEFFCNKKNIFRI